MLCFSSVTRARKRQLRGSDLRQGFGSFAVMPAMFTGGRPPESGNSEGRATASGAASAHCQTLEALAAKEAELVQQAHASDLARLVKLFNGRRRCSL